MLEVYKAMNIQVVVLGDVATCSAVVGHEPFRGPWCVHHTEDGGSIWIRTQTARWWEVEKTRGLNHGEHTAHVIVRGEGKGREQEKSTLDPTCPELRTSCTKGHFLTRSVYSLSKLQ